jgi:hypothetical protein
MTKLIVIFCNFVNVPKNSSENSRQEHIGLLYVTFHVREYCLLYEKIKFV